MKFGSLIMVIGKQNPLRSFVRKYNHPRTEKKLSARKIAAKAVKICNNVQFTSISACKTG